MSAAASLPGIRVRGLRKSFGRRTVLDGIDLDVAPGSIFSLLGPNGAGKTTTVQILSTLLEPDAGDVQVNGLDLRTQAAAVRRVIGVTGQFSAVDNLLTGEENLALMARLNHLERRAGTRRAAELLERFALEDQSRRTVATYSGGERRRLDLAMTLIGDPRVIFLDEPTTGLDPRSRRTTWETVEDLVAGGVTIFLTTQQLEEADRLADMVAVLDSGRIVALGTPEQLKRRLSGGHVQLRFRDPEGLRQAARLLGEAGVDDETLALRVPTDGTAASLKAVLDRFDPVRLGIEQVTVHTPDLDDVFLSLTASTHDEPEVLA